MLPRLAQICTKYIHNYLNSANVLSVLLVAHAHNATELCVLCIDFICLNEAQVVCSQEWEQFRKLTDPSLLVEFGNMVRDFKQ